MDLLMSRYHQPVKYFVETITFAELVGLLLDGMPKNMKEGFGSIASIISSLLGGI